VTDSIQAASDNAFWYGAAILFAYVFGSIADDFDKRRTQRKLGETAAKAEATTPTPEGE
jgi:hypothetical protein